jgi:hypothetical protein
MGDQHFGAQRFKEPMWVEVGPGQKQMERTKESPGFSSFLPKQDF